MATYDVAIVGGGHNGLACAALLAKSGMSVVLFERREFLGGAAATEAVWEGYTASAALYVGTLLDPWLVKELELQRHGYVAQRKDPATFNVLEDGRSLLLGADEAANEREIAAFDRADVEGFREVDLVVRRLGSELSETFSEEDPRFERFSPRTRELLCGSAADIVERYVETPVLQAAIATGGIIGTYRGPRDAGTGYVLAHHYAGRALGVQGSCGYIRGGMGGISDALASAARDYGATIVQSAPVRTIVVRDGSAEGVVLEDGSEINVRAIASNAHPRTTFFDLVGEAALDRPFADKVRAWESNGPVFKLNLALGELPDFRSRRGAKPLAHHRATIHVAPSLDYLQQAYRDAKERGSSPRPMLECFLQTPTDPPLASRGKHILSIFAQYYPYDRRPEWKSLNREAVADQITTLFAEFAPNVAGAVEGRQILGPADLQSRFGLIGGHIFHGELVPGQIYEDRFASRTPIRNLYLCGSGAHPGGCVSGFPGKRAACAILADIRELSAAT